MSDAYGLITMIGVSLGTDFEPWVQAIRAFYQPEGPLEQALIDRIALSMWRLRPSGENEKAAPDREQSRIRSDEERSLSRALSDWARLCKARKSTRPSKHQPPAPEDNPAAASEPDPAPYTPPSGPVSWPDHVTFDPSIDPAFPILKGTDLGVDFVASLFDEGLTPEEIHREHPILTGDQIEAARLCASAGYAGPWPSGVPQINPVPRAPAPGLA